MDPNFPMTIYSIGLCYEQKGMYEEAVAAYRNASASSGNSFGIPAVAYASAMSGRKGQAREVLQELFAASKQRYISPYLIAIVYTGLNKKQALQWLDKAYAERDERMVMLKVEHRLDTLRSDPRFADLLRRVGLAP